MDDESTLATESTLVQLSQREKEIINRTVIERSLGGKGFSVALRMIVREWDEMQAQLMHRNDKPATQPEGPLPA